MSKSVKSSPKKRRPLRKLVFLAVLTGTAVAIKNALEDKGGSYEAPAAPHRVPTPPTPSAAPAPTSAAPASSVVTAEDIVVQRPVENLDEFADPVPAPAPVAEEPVAEAPAEEAPVEQPAEEPVTRIQPAVDPLDEAVAAEQPVDDSAPVADEDTAEEPVHQSRRARKRSAVAEALDKADKSDDSPGKIDPFGIR